MKSMAVIIDYQNVMLMGHSIFASERPLHEMVIDPHRFACQIARVKNQGLDQSDPGYVKVTRVEVYRGCPSQQRNPEGYARNQAQRSRWMQGLHGVVDVNYRTLNYYVEVARWS